MSVPSCYASGITEEGVYTFAASALAATLLRTIKNTLAMVV